MLFFEPLWGLRDLGGETQKAELKARGIYVKRIYMTGGIQFDEGSEMTKYDQFVERCRLIGVEHPSKKAYAKAYTELKEFIDRLMDVVVERKLPPSFTITGDWVTTVTEADGRRVYVRGENLRINVQ